MDDADVVVVDEQDDAGSVEGSSEADVVEVAVDAQGDVAGVDAVVADAELGVVVPVGVALGRVRVGGGGVARCGSERCGRWWL